jgi:hypothetical protein
VAVNPAVQLDTKMEPGSACVASFCGYSRLRAKQALKGVPKLAPVMRLAKVVPVSMADGVAENE